jgi:hypothetical protein
MKRRADPNYTLSPEDLCAEMHISLEALQFLRQKLKPAPVQARFQTPEGNIHRFPPSAREWLLERVCTIKQMTDLLELSRHVVNKQVKAGPYAQDFDCIRIRGGHQEFRYSRACLGYVFDQTAEFRSLPRFSSHWVLTRDACRELTLSWQALRNIADGHPELDIHIQMVRVPGGRSGTAIRDTAYRRLVDWLPDIAPDDWAPVTRLAAQTGWSVRYLERQLAKAERRLYRAYNDNIVWHYRIADAEALGSPPPSPPAGDWLTVRALAQRLGRSPGWVGANANQDLAEFRLDDKGARRLHYPPVEEHRLRRLIKAGVEGDDLRTFTPSEFTPELAAEFPHTHQSLTAEIPSFSSGQVNAWCATHRTAHTAVKLVGVPGRNQFRYSDQFRDSLLAYVAARANPATVPAFTDRPEYCHTATSLAHEEGMSAQFANQWLNEQSFPYIERPGYRQTRFYTSDARDAFLARDHRRRPDYTPASEGESEPPRTVHIRDFTPELRAAFPYTAADFAAAAGIQSPAANKWLRRNRTSQTCLWVFTVPGQQYYYGAALYEAWVKFNTPTSPRS